MKTIAMLIFSFALQANAAYENYDGCYQLVATGVMYNPICISGTTEEGIGGARAMLAVFRTNTSTMSQCIYSTSIVITENEFKFQVNGVDELVLSNADRRSNGTIFDAALGNSTMKAVKLGEEHTTRLMSIAQQSPLCR